MKNFRKKISNLLIISIIPIIAFSCVSIPKKNKLPLFDINKLITNNEKLISFGTSYFIDEKTNEPMLYFQEYQTKINSNLYKYSNSVYKLNENIPSKFPIIEYTLFTKQYLNSSNNLVFNQMEITKYDCGEKKLNSIEEIPEIKNFNPDGKFDFTDINSIVNNYNENSKIFNNEENKDKLKSVR